jgi:hypothetical protein
MTSESKTTLLKKLLMSRHLETHRAFRLEYDKIARKLDRNLIASAPGREQYARWLAGRVKTKPSADHCRVLEHMFPGRTVAELLAPYDPETETSGISDMPSDNQEAATNRRQMFQLGVISMTSGLASNLVHGPDWLERALDATSVHERRLLFLETEAEHIAEQMEKLPAGRLLHETLSCLSSVRDLLSQRQPSDVQHRLARLGAKLSILIGQVVFNHSQFVLARSWYRAAIRAADEAGDRPLADLALASIALIPTYSDDPNGVLIEITSRLENQGMTATPAIAWLWGFSALAHAKLGNRSAFDRAINNSRSTLSRCAPEMMRPGCLSFLPERHTFYQARGLADLGDVNGTRRATLEALAAYDPTDNTDPALVRFAYASVLAKSGEAEEACRVAGLAISDPHIFPSIPVVVRAHEFDALLDPKAPSTRDWREVLADVQAPDPSSLHLRPLGGVPGASGPRVQATHLAGLLPY